MPTVRRTADEMHAATEQYLRNVRTDRKATALWAMHLRHGITIARRCGDCAHFSRRRGDTQGTYFKCLQYGLTNGPGTDWRVGWPACGLFVKPGAVSK